MQKMSIKAARVNATLTRKEVAEKIGKKEEDIAAWENKEILLKEDELQILARLYAMPEEYLRQ